MVIKGHTELLLGSLFQTDPTRRKIEQIERSADRATALTRQLLAFSRMQVLQPRSINLNSIVEEMGKLDSRRLRRLDTGDQFAHLLDNGIQIDGARLQHCMRLKASSCRVRAVARRRNVQSVRFAPRGSVWNNEPSRSSVCPLMTISKLLKSCATPPASLPTASIFCAWQIVLPTAGAR